MTYPSKDPNVVAGTAVLDVFAAAIIFIVTGFDSEFWGIMGIGFFVLGIVRFVFYLSMMERARNDTDT